ASRVPWRLAQTRSGSARSCVWLPQGEAEVDAEGAKYQGLVGSLPTRSTVQRWATGGSASPKTMPIAQGARRSLRIARIGSTKKTASALPTRCGQRVPPSVGFPEQLPEWPRAVFATKLRCFEIRKEAK